VHSVGIVKTEDVALIAEELVGLSSFGRPGRAIVVVEEAGVIIKLIADSVGVFGELSMV
jgi:hypothetical protein